jgi:hypothetical protein
VDPVDVHELATIVNKNPPHYFLMYGVVVQTFNLWFPLTQFEISLLHTLNIAPIQLHPNSWGFAKAYEIVCLALGLTPSIGVFFSFYHLKSFTADRLVSLCALPNRTLFSLYANNFKNYQDSFFRIRGGPKCQDVMYDSDGAPLFPFYWSANPRLVKGADTTTTRKKENSGSQLVAIDVEPLPLPCLPAVMPAVQTVAVCVFSFLTFSCFNKTIET